jgi:hypothetical protein
VRSCGQLSRPPRVRPIAPPRVSRSGSRTRGRRLPEPSGPTAPGPTHPPTARRPPRGCAPTRAGSAVGRASSSRVRRTGPRVVAAAAAASRQPDGEEIGRALHDRGTHARRRARGAWREATAFVDTASRRSDSRSGPAQAGARRLAAPPRSSSRPSSRPITRASNDSRTASFHLVLGERTMGAGALPASRGGLERAWHWDAARKTKAQVER